MGRTIYALASGAPPAALAVIRISGPDARAVLVELTDSVPEPRKVSLRRIKDRDGSAIDEALVTFFAGPESFTGEDVAELAVHGGRAVLAAVLRRLAGLDGLGPAEPGEFSRRAFLNRKMDLAQVEGLADLVQAETEAQRRAAERVAGGGLGRLVEAWRERLVRARALVEAGLDFVDEGDVTDEVGRKAWGEVEDLAEEIALYLDAGTAERLRDGMEVVIVGAPNAGKSSLLNALAKRDVAIVTPEAGTTRDVLEVHLDLGGYPVTVVDTAGLREAASMAEREGIRRAEERARRADLVLALEDLTRPEAPALELFPISPNRKLLSVLSFLAISDGKVESTFPEIALPVSAPILRVGSKADLIESGRKQARPSGRYDMVVSAKTGEGLGALTAAIERFARESFAAGESSLITRERHRLALEASVAAMRKSLAADSAVELRAEELRRATDALGRITGRVGVEDLLDVIFRELCIGK
jgi:tRNA modification GTPase